MQMYVYRADLWCEDCGKIIRDAFPAEEIPDDPDNEITYDSNQYPKGPYDPSESDAPEHCASHEDCVNAYVLPSGEKVGAWLENELTSVGVDFLKEVVQDGGEVVEQWSKWYADYLY